MSLHQIYKTLEFFQFDYSIVFMHSLYPSLLVPLCEHTLSNTCFTTELSQRMFFHRRETPEQILCVQGLKPRLGELTAALGGVDLHARQLIEPLNRQDHRLAVPVRNRYSCFVVELVFCIRFISPVCEKMFWFQSHKRLEKGFKNTYNRSKTAKR